MKRWHELNGIQKEDITSLIANEKYGFIAGALAETFHKKKERDDAKTTRIIDAFVTNKLFGFPIFLLIMLFIFWCTFEIGSYPMEWIEWLVAKIAEAVNVLMPDGPLKDLIADGIIGGVGGVIVFLPNILILYFFISFMEDSGYMARAAFIMDKIMHKIGLHGKSFIPLVMGFGCNVPAIMSARAIESRSSRIITILIKSVYVMFCQVAGLRLAGRHIFQCSCKSGFPWIIYAWRTCRCDNGKVASTFLV